jgi:DNA polymerase V
LTKPSRINRVCDNDPIEYGRRLRNTVLRSTGIPVCVGMDPTKTLAKLANFAAKKWKETRRRAGCVGPDPT